MKNFSLNKACFLCVILIFFVLRLFYSEPYYFVAVDEARYLGLAQNFPYHTLYSDTLFLQHMPTYPYLIALTDFLLHNDLASGLLISFIMELLLLLVLLYGFYFLGKSYSWLFLFALFFSLNWPLVELSRMVFKDTNYVFFFWASVVFYFFGLTKSRKFFWLSGVFVGITALSSDQVIFLFPLLALALYFFNQEKLSWYKFIPFVFGAAAYSFWLFLRLNFYLTHTVAPIGVDGLIENVSSFGVGQLLSPFSFPESQRLTEAGFTIDVLQILGGSLGYLINTYPFLIKPNLSRVNLVELFSIKTILFVLIWYIPVFLLILQYFFIHLKEVVVKKKVSNNLDLFFILVFFILLTPMFTGVGVWRHIILAVIPLIYVQSEVITGYFNNLLSRNFVKFCFVIFSVVFIASWLYSHPYFSLASEKVVQGYKLAEELRNLPGQGVFVQTGYSMEQAYLLPEKRVYGIVSNIADFNNYLERFNISYVVLGNKTWAPVDEPSLEHIKSNSDRFVPIKTVEEDYPVKDISSDRFIIYLVKK